MSRYELKRRQNPGYDRKSEMELSEEDHLSFVIDKLFLSYDLRDEYRTNELIDCYRYLRNRLGAFESSSSTSTRLNPLLENSEALCRLVEEHLSTIDFGQQGSESAMAMLRIAVQFLGNAVARDETSSEFRDSIWRNGEGMSFFIALINHVDEKLRRFGSMMIYNCLRDSKILDAVARCTEFVEIILDCLSIDSSSTDSQWCLFIIQKLLADDEMFLENIWPKLVEDHRLILTRCARDLVFENNVGAVDAIPVVGEKNAAFLSTIFVDESSRLSKSDGPIDDDDQQLRLSVLVLDFLCEATCSEDRYQSIRYDDRILVAALTFLKKTADRVNDQRKQFDDLARRLRSLGDDDAAEAPVERSSFGFRSRLIRLLANLNYKNPSNQKLMRERDGVALVMDSTTLDASNPFITEWSIFALRNLLDECPENQRILESTKPQTFASDFDRLVFEKTRTNVDGKFDEENAGNH